MDAYASWCGPCKRMAANVFPKEDVGDFFNANFVNLKIDMEKGEGIDLRRKYGVSAYPTLLFLDSEGNVVSTARGARDANGLIALGQKAVVPNQAMVDAMKKRWKDGERESSFLYNYTKTLSMLKSDYNEPFDAYLSSLTNEEVFGRQKRKLDF